MLEDVRRMVGRLVWLCTLGRGTAREEDVDLRRVVLVRPMSDVEGRNGGLEI